MTTTQIALFDTGAGLLQWIGQAKDHQAAIRTHLRDVGLSDDVEVKLLAMDVTPDQAAALQAWSNAGSKSSEYPEGLPTGVIYDAAETAAIAAG